MAGIGDDVKFETTSSRCWPPPPISTPSRRLGQHEGRLRQPRRRPRLAGCHGPNPSPTHPAPPAEPVIRRRLRNEVKTRVLDPYRDNDHWWWLGLGKADLNNWTPWIHSNLLAASLLLETMPQDILATVSRTVGALDRYLDAVPDDGGCDEGIGYWWRAGGSLFECLEILSSACGDDFGVFQIQKIRAIARYPVVAHCRHTALSTTVSTRGFGAS